VGGFAGGGPAGGGPAGGGAGAGGSAGGGAAAGGSAGGDAGAGGSAGGGSLYLQLGQEPLITVGGPYDAPTPAGLAVRSSLVLGELFEVVWREHQTVHEVTYTLNGMALYPARVLDDAADDTVAGGNVPIVVVTASGFAAVWLTQGGLPMIAWLEMGIAPSVGPANTVTARTTVPVGAYDGERVYLAWTPTGTLGTIDISTFDLNTRAPVDVGPAAVSAKKQAMSLACDSAQHCLLAYVSDDVTFGRVGLQPLVGGLPSTATPLFVMGGREPAVAINGADALLVCETISQATSIQAVSMAVVPKTLSSPTTVAAAIGTTGILLAPYMTGYVVLWQNQGGIDVLGTSLDRFGTPVNTPSPYIADTDLNYVSLAGDTVTFGMVYFK
jgi:hypothetical protein